MKTANSLIVALLACLTLGGCATSRSALDVSVPAASNVSQPNGKTVFINSAVDKRSFQTAPSTPEIPSLDPSEDQSDKVRLRAIGRKRNGFGKALGDILLKEGSTVETMTSASIAQAFSDNGYRVIANKNEATNETFIVDASINKFWAWMNPGMWAITLSTEISTDLTIKSSNGSEIKKVSVKASDNYQVGTESNWIEVIDKALRLYVDDLKSKIK
ncbi:MAG: flagellar biosynthesis protein [Betaproteobacteria bacterium]